MRQRERKIVARRKRNLQRRLDRKNMKGLGEPIFRGGNVHYELSDRVGAMSFGGVGAIHKMVQMLGLDRSLNAALRLLKVHAPYFESDHVLNIAYNVMTDGKCLEDIERLRNDTTYMDGIGAERIPDPTTAGDFLRRFSEGEIIDLMEAVNDKREKVWSLQEESFFDRAIVEVDATVAETLGECKEGMDLSYKGVWGYAPLMVSLANTREPLYLVNRPGNTPSCKDAAPWIDRAIERLSRKFKKILVRGDTDFSLTEHLDKWDEKAEFIFGYDAYSNLVTWAEALSDDAWGPLVRKSKYTVETQERMRPANVKEEIVRKREYKNIRLDSEEVAEFDYRPTKCKKTYRMVVVRKNLTVEKGELALFDDIRYFFYITNISSDSKDEIVFSANQRCDQENLFAQFKSGINALRMPTSDLVSNWAYMVIASLAWTLKAWYGLLIPDKKESRRVVRMEFKRFFHSFVMIPCQILRRGRRLVYRILNYNASLETFFETFDVIRKLRLIE